MKTFFKLIAIAFVCCFTFAASAQPSQDYNILIEDIEFLPGVTIDINVNVYVNENAQSQANTGKIIAIEGMAHTANCMKPLAEALFENTDPTMEINEFFAIDSPGKGLSGLPEGGGFMFDQLYVEHYLDIFFAVIGHLNAMDIYPRTIMGHSLGGLYTLKLQDTLVKQGTNLKEQFGITNCILLAPAIPGPVAWSFIGSPLAQGLLAYAQFFVPGYGSILNMPPAAWVYSLFTNTCCYFPPNAVPGAPTPAQAAANGYVGIEPAPMLLQLTGMSIPAGLPYPYRSRIQANAGIFMAQHGVNLTLVADEFDRMMHPDEEEILYGYLTGDATLSQMHTILGEETCHDTHIADPHAVVDIMDMDFNPVNDGGGYTIFNDQFFSNALGQIEMVDVWLPPGYDMNMDQQYPVIYLLHKAFSNENEYEWFLPALNQMVADGEIDPFIIVKPNGWAPPYLGSCWYNSPLYGNYEDMLLNDLIPYIEGNFRVLPGQDYRYHLGQAMGGHAGWSMSIRYPELFSVVADISGYKHQALLNQLSVGLILAESGGSPPYTYSPANGQLSALWFTMLGAYAPNMANPPYYVNVTVDENGNFIPVNVEQYLQDDIASMISGATQPAETKYWFANGLTDNVSPYPIALAFKDTLDKYGWEYEFYTYDGGYSGVGDPLAEAFRFINGVWKEKLETQTLELEQGWSLISSYLMPENPMLDEIFEVPSGNQQVIFALNSDGIYWPGQNINTMKYWWTKQAMKIKAAENFNMDISGVVYLDKTVEIMQGINYMPVLSDEPVEAAAIFNQIGNENLHYAFDISNMLVYWPQGEIFTLNELLPGTGYIVNTYTDAEVDFGNVGKSSIPEPLQTANQPDNIKSTGVQHLIVISADALADFNKGSVFAVENENGKTLSTTKFADNTLPLILIANGDDPTTEAVDGFVADEKIYISCLDAQTLEFTRLDCEFDTEIGLAEYFTEWGISKVSALKNSTGINTLSAVGMLTIKPNPVTTSATITWHMDTPGNAELSLLNNKGSEILKITDGYFDIGNCRYILHTNNLDAGVYFCKLAFGNTTTFEKIVVIK